MVSAIQNLKSEIWNMKPQVWNLESRTWNLKPEVAKDLAVKKVSTLHGLPSLSWYDSDDLTEQWRTRCLKKRQACHGPPSHSKLGRSSSRAASFSAKRWSRWSKGCNLARVDETYEISEEDMKELWQLRLLSDVFWSGGRWESRIGAVGAAATQIQNRKRKIWNGPNIKNESPNSYQIKSHIHMSAVW